MSNYFPGSQIAQPATIGTLVTGFQSLNGQWGYRIKAKASSTTIINLETVGPMNVAGGQVIPNGLTTEWDTSTQNAMDANGDSTGSAVNTSTSTVFKVYWCSAGTFANGLGFSTTAPTQVNGQYVLGAAGTPSKCLFLGWLFIDSVGLIADTLQNRGVTNYYNRRPTMLEIVPGYSDTNVTTTYSRTLNVWGSQHATASLSQTYFIANGEDSSFFWATFTVLTGNATSHILNGIGFTTTTPLATASMPNAAFTGLSSACSYCWKGSAGIIQTPQMLAFTGNQPVSFVADWIRSGASADTPATYMRGLIMA